MKRETTTTEMRKKRTRLCDRYKKRIVRFFRDVHNRVKFGTFKETFYNKWIVNYTLYNITYELSRYVSSVAETLCRQMLERL